MAEVKKQELVRSFLQTIVDIISRRTSESYSSMVLNNVFRNLNSKHVFLRDIEIKNPQFSEVYNMVDIKSDLSFVNEEEIKTFTIDVINELINSMGRSAGFFFIKEIKQELPTDYEKQLKNLGVDFGIMQLEFILEKSSKYLGDIENSDVIKHIFCAIYDILESEQSREFAINTIFELVERFSTKYDVLNKIKVNDISVVKDVDIISVVDDVDTVDRNEMGEAIQKILQETNNYLVEKECFSFIEKFHTKIDPEYSNKLISLGVNLNTIHMKQGLVIKKIIKALVEVLNEISPEKNPVMFLDEILNVLKTSNDSLKYINIDSSKYSEGINAISISKDINLARSSEIGKGFGKLIEKIAFSFGRHTGIDFIKKLKKHLGRAYLLRIEEMGVNLYMMELRLDLSR